MTYFSPIFHKKIIKNKPRSRRSRRGSGKAQAIGNKQTAAASAAAKVVKAASRPAPPAVAQVAEKIIVSNLPVDVNEAQLKVYFLIILSVQHH